MNLPYIDWVSYLSVDFLFTNNFLVIFFFKVFYIFLV